MKGTRFLISSVVFVILFLVTAWLAMSNYSQSVDKQILFSIYDNGGQAITTMMILASKYGREYFWITIVGIMLLFGKKETRTLGIELAILFVAGIVIGDALKAVIYRPRPFITYPQIQSLFGTDTDSSFPSGHALIVSIGSLFCFVRFKRKIISTLLAIEAAFVCYSRVYIGMHYPTDVIAGIFVGCAIVLFGLYVMDSFLAKFMSSLGSTADKVLRAIHLPSLF